jgi:Tfp pilus assembly protein PilO
MKRLLSVFNKLEMDNKTIAAVVIACALVAYVDYAFLLKMQLVALKTISPKIVKLKADLDALNNDLKSGQYAKSRQDEGAKSLAKGKKVIPNEQVASLLQGISEIANKDDVDIIQMKPALELPGKQKKQDNQQRFTPLLITLDLVSDYHHLGAFISDLENAQVLIAVTDLKIMPVEDNYLKQQVRLVLRAYVSK